MSTFSILLAIATFIAFLAAIFFVIFGQVTVRRLRKNPKTKNELGVEFVSGWDIINVAKALAMPRWLNRKFRSSQLSFLHADPDLIDRHTNGLDRVLATIFYVLLNVSGFGFLILMVLDQFFDAFT